MAALAKVSLPSKNSRACCCPSHDVSTSLYHSRDDANSTLLPEFFLTADVTVCILCPQPRSHRSEMPSIHLLETRNKMRMDGTYVEDLKGAQVIDVHVLCAG